MPRIRLHVIYVQEWYAGFVHFSTSLPPQPPSSILNRDVAVALVYFKPNLRAGFIFNVFISSRGCTDIRDNKGFR